MVEVVVFERRYDDRVETRNDSETDVVDVENTNLSYKGTWEKITKGLYGYLTMNYRKLSYKGRKI